MPPYTVRHRPVPRWSRSAGSLILTKQHVRQWPQIAETFEKINKQNCIHQAKQYTEATTKHTCNKPYLHHHYFSSLWWFGCHWLLFFFWLQKQKTASLAFFSRESASPQNGEVLMEGRHQQHRRHEKHASPAWITGELKGKHLQQIADLNMIRTRLRVARSTRKNIFFKISSIILHGYFWIWNLVCKQQRYVIHNESISERTSPKLDSFKHIQTFKPNTRDLSVSRHGRTTSLLNEKKHRGLAKQTSRFFKKKCGSNWCRFSNEWILQVGVAVVIFQINLGTLEVVAIVLISLKVFRNYNY